jgi:hypothetical protein
VFTEKFKVYVKYYKGCVLGSQEKAGGAVCGGLFHRRLVKV